MHYESAYAFQSAGGYVIRRDFMKQKTPLRAVQKTGSLRYGNRALQTPMKIYLMAAAPGVCHVSTCKREIA